MSLVILPCLFPAEFVVVNGVMQSFLLLIVYLFVWVNIFYSKSILMEAGDEATLAGLQDLNGKRSYERIFKIILAILAPLLSSTIEPIIKAFS